MRKCADCFALKCRLEDAFKVDGLLCLEKNRNYWYCTAHKDYCANITECGDYVTFEEKAAECDAAWNCALNAETHEPLSELERLMINELGVH